MTADPFEALLAAAAAWGAPLDAASAARLRSYLEQVRAANAAVNLTADDSWEDLTLKHGADGVFAASVLRRRLAGRPAPRICDLGSGGGFIGIALKLAWPEPQVTLMESVERKFRFLNKETARLGLPGLRAVKARAGDGRPRSSYETGFDAVVERALAPLPEAVALALPLLAPGGVFAAFQSDEPDPAEPALAKALARTGAVVLESCAYRRPGEARERRLVIFGRED